MLSFVPEDPFWRLLPIGVLAALSLWGLVSPGTQWPVMWARSRRYQDVHDPAERARIVRAGAVVPFVLSVVLTCMLGPDRG